MESDLEIELKAQLQVHHAISTLPMFGDFLWDSDGSLDEYLVTPPAIVIDAADSPRRIVVQRVRGELRYWLTTNRDPARMDGKTELGVIATVEDLVGLCEEFLGRAVQPADLKDRTRMRSRRRVLALVTGASCWLLPGIAHAEVDDKIPGTISLLFATMVVAAVTGFVVWAMKGSHILRLALLALLIVIASALIFELRFSDISEAVSTEMGRPYIALVWMLVVLPLSGAIGIVLQGRHREDGSGSRSRSGGSVRPTTR